MATHKKRRVNLTLDQKVFEALRLAMFRREKPANFLIEQALRKYLSIPREKEQRP
jgi:hypothetical protein